MSETRAPTSRAAGALVAACLLGSVASCRKVDSHPRVDEKSTLTGARFVTTPGPPSEDDGWPMATKDYANTRYSRLALIDTTNVKDLRVAWTFDTGLDKGHEAAPLVIGGSMYVVTPYPNELHAFDLSKPGAPPKWTYRPDPAPAAQGEACCDVVNRGAAFANGKVIFNTLDAWTVAVDAASGHEVWRTKLGDVDKGETMTMAPMIAKGKVLVGNSGGEMGVRG
jgi:glucose dehydrogenase